MKYLIDTAVLLWTIFNKMEKISPETGKILASPDHTIILSAVCTWEIAIKYSLGKLMLRTDPVELIEGLFLRHNLQRLPITHEHTLATAKLPFHHKDPFDRLLIAQAKIEELPIITPDGHFRLYGVDVIW